MSDPQHQPISDRGMIGVLPRPARLEDESYLEYVTTFRKFIIQDMFSELKRSGEEKYEAERKIGSDGSDDETLTEIKSIFRSIPVARTWQRFLRSQQEMMWRKTRESFLEVADTHLEALERAEKEGPGRLEYDPNFEVPDWARREIHLQPGGYTDDPIGGLIFHYGTKVFYEGYNDQDEHHKEFAGLLAVPEDGKLDRILDVGCSIGQCAMELKRLHPNSDITGLDVGLPLLRYAHYRAQQEDLAITYTQQLAQATNYPDGHFDAVLSYILFHEVPIKIIPEIVNEMARVLRPGGKFTIFEFPNHTGEPLEPAHRYLVDFDSKNNCEPYSIDFVNSDFRAMLIDAGFEIEDGPESSNKFLQSIVATKK